MASAGFPLLLAGRLPRPIAAPHQGHCESNPKAREGLDEDVQRDHEQSGREPCHGIVVVVVVVREFCVTRRLRLEYAWRAAAPGACRAGLLDAWAYRFEKFRFDRAYVSWAAPRQFSVLVWTFSS